MLKNGINIEIHQHTLERQCDPEYVEELVPILGLTQINERTLADSQARAVGQHQDSAMLQRRDRLEEP